MAYMWENTPPKYAMTFGLILEHWEKLSPGHTVLRRRDSQGQRRFFEDSDNLVTASIFGPKNDHCTSLEWHFGFPALSTELRRWISGKNPYGPKSVQKSWHILEGYFPTCKPSRYTKQNQWLWSITTSKGFRIGPFIKEILGCWIFPRTLNNPVCLVY